MPKPVISVSSGKAAAPILVDALDEAISMQTLIDALCILQNDGCKYVKPAELISALLETTAQSDEVELGVDDFLIPTEPNSPVNAHHAPSTRPASAPANVPTNIDSAVATHAATATQTAGANASAAAAAIPSVAAAVAAAAPPAPHPMVSVLQSGDNVDPTSRVPYHIAEDSGSGLSWYSVSRGRRVGVFEGWATVAPYVVGAKCVCYTKFAGRDAAIVAFATTLAAGQISVIRS